MSLQDSDFLDEVTSDVREFVEDRSEKRVLIFPPVNNYRRFLIHKLIEEEFGRLKTFSIGEGESRRTVVCFKKDYLLSEDTLETLHESQTHSKVVRKVSKGEGSDSGNSEQAERPRRAKRIRTMPSIGIYRPPAARKLEQDESVSNLHRSDVASNNPEQHRCQIAEQCDTGQINRRCSSKECGVSMFRSAISSIKTQSQPHEKTSPPSAKIVLEDSQKKPDLKTPQGRQRRPDIQVYVPKGRRIAEEKVPPKSEKLITVKSEVAVMEFSPEALVDGDWKREPQNSPADCEVLKTDGLETSKVYMEPKQVASLWIEAQNAVVREPETVIVPSQPYEDCDSIAISSDDSSANSLSNSCEKISDIKEILSEVCGKDKECEALASGTLNPEECDWDAMYDEHGECLDPSLLEQLSMSVGEVTIEKPKSSYDGFKNKNLDAVADEFPHVIEIYNFPPEFKTQDLMTVFSQFKNSGFEIRWVDDTHALGIFSSSNIVSEVLSFHHPFVKTRSLKEGTPGSKTKARRSAEFLQPYRARPDTCAALARRLVTGALGVKLSTSREEREAERKLLREAREKKKLAAKQRDEAWEGNFS